MEEAGIKYIVGVVKRVVGSGFDIKGRGGMGIGLPESKLKVENIEAAAQKFEAATSIGFLSSMLRFDKFLKMITILTIEEQQGLLFLEEGSVWEEAGELR